MFTIGLFLAIVGWCLKVEDATWRIGDRAVRAGLVLIGIDLALTVLILAFFVIVGIPFEYLKVFG